MSKLNIIFFTLSTKELNTHFGFLSDLKKGIS